MKQTLVCALVALVMTMSAGRADADRSVNETRRLAADGTVEVSNVSGEVTVVGHADDTVVITGTLEDGVDELEITSSGARVRIEVDLKRRVRSGGSAYLKIAMPITADLEVETVSADISVDGIGGEVDLESVSGEIDVGGEPRAVEAGAVSGDITVTTAAGRSELETVSGDIIVRHASGRLDTNVVSGRIEIADGVLDTLTGETVSGSIFCAAAPRAGGRFELETMSGRIELVVPSNIDADFHIETFSGSIKNSFGPAPAPADEDGPGKVLKFRAGSGGARISVESFSGSVKLKTR